VPVWWPAGSNLSRHQSAVVTGVAKYLGTWARRQKCRSLRAIVPLAASDVETDRIAECVDQQMHFARGAAARPADSLRRVTAADAHVGRIDGLGLPIMTFGDPGQHPRPDPALHPAAAEGYLHPASSGTPLQVPPQAGRARYPQQPLDEWLVIVSIATQARMNSALSTRVGPNKTPIARLRPTVGSALQVTKTRTNISQTSIPCVDSCTQGAT